MKTKKSKKRPCRHQWGSMKYHSDSRDGNYQTCEKCGAVRFEGDRYTYGSRGG